MINSEIQSILGEEAENLLSHTCTKITKEQIHQTGQDHVRTIFSQSNRSVGVIENLEWLYNSGRLGKTGYLSIFPVDQGMEHTGAYSFYSNPLFFDPENVVKFAVEGECNAIASTLGILGLVSRKYSEKIPFIVKLNHSEHLTLPEISNQIPFASVQQAADMGAAGVGATIYFGSKQSHRQIEEIAIAFEKAHALGMFTVLWCYPRNPNYQGTNPVSQKHENYESAVDITSQAIHIGVTLGADIVKQKMPSPALGFMDLDFSKYSKQMYDDLLTPHPIDLVRYQVANAYMGKIGLINSGGESGSSDLHDAIKAAVINKRGGGHGLIMGRKLFKKPWKEGLSILRAVQNVYLDDSISIA